MTSKAQSTSGQNSGSPDAIQICVGSGGGYTGTIAVPRAFLSRNPHFAIGQSQTTMVDDTPTESWLYPQFQGDAVVK